ncbi:MAG TPA: FAD-dependent oxidoreductase [Solirubrobacteraceae bacterium]|nr:FAD-dependent oxidoreductase [Solirubrobacteraceae bacterium]
MAQAQKEGEPLKVLIAGGGVGGLEALLALRELAGDAVSVTVLAREPEFVYRPMTVREPFGFSRAQRYPLNEITADLGAELVHDSLERVDPAAQMARTDTGRELRYDALLLALGAGLTARFAHAITLDDRQIDEQLHGLIQDVEGGYVRRLAFIAPSPMPWPLPMYELALMTAGRAYDMNVELSVTIATPEEAPLNLFGTAASDGVAKLLKEHGIHLVTSAHCDVPEPGRVTIAPGDRSLEADRIVALPQLLGPSLEGIPATHAGGFIPVDEYCRVRGAKNIWAAGDATDFPVKLGGIAAQQADVAAAEIANLAGAAVTPEPFAPEVHAILLGARHPLYLSAHITGGHGTSSELSEAPTWSPTAKIAARYLAPYLETRDASRTAPDERS